jgi:hypothetical protein
VLNRYALACSYFQPLAGDQTEEIPASRALM